MQKINSIPLARCFTSILAYGTTTHLPVLGTFTATIESSSNCTVSTIHVIRGNCGCLLSYYSVLAHGLVQMKVSSLNNNGSPKHKQLVEEFQEIF